MIAAMEDDLWMDSSSRNTKNLGRRMVQKVFSSPNRTIGKIMSKVKEHDKTLENVNFFNSVDDDNGTDSSSFTSVAFSTSSPKKKESHDHEGTGEENSRPEPALLQDSCNENVLEERPTRFYDSQSDALVEISNFSFAGNINHFCTNRGETTSDRVADEPVCVREREPHAETKISTAESSDSSLALLDPRCLASDVNDEDAFDLQSDLLQSVTKPKILSPARPAVVSRSRSPRGSLSSEDGARDKPTLERRKLSDDMILPSRSNPAMPRSAPRTSTVNVDVSARTRIPRFLKMPRNESLQEANQHSGNGPVRRKLAKNNGASCAKRAGRLSLSRSRSASNLSRLSVIDYHNLKSKGVGGGGGVKPATKGQSRSSSCGNIADYSHVESKVKRYIVNAKRDQEQQQQQRNKVEDEYGKSFVLSPGRGSLSMSNLVVDEAFADRNSTRGSSSCSSGKMKAFLSSRHLDDVQVTVRASKSRANSCTSGRSSKSRDGCHNLEEQSRLHRLLDHLSDYEDTGLAEYDGENSEEDDVCIYPIDSNQEEVVVEVEDLLKLAIDERRGKQEAKHVLAELQKNYDTLQQKYARAENIIDAFRFGSRSGPSAQSPPPPDEASEVMDGSERRPPRSEMVAADSTLPTSEKVTRRLTEIQEQVFAMELLATDSVECDLTSVEKDALVNELLSGVQDLKVQLQLALQGARKPERLLEALRNAAAQEEKINQLREAVGRGGLSTSVDQPTSLASFEDVEGQLGRNKQCIQAACSSYPTTSSCPTPGSKNRVHSLENVSTCDLDSGCCLGSDRSNARVARAKHGRPKVAKVKSRLPNDFNVNRAADGILSRDKKVTARASCLPSAGARKCLRSLTDLSSDERNVVTTDSNDKATNHSKASSAVMEKELERMATSSSTGISPRKNDDGDVTPATPSTAFTLSGLQLPHTSPSGYTPRGGNTMILAQQIDREISELRSVFEAHRDQMISLLEAGKTVQLPRDGRGFSVNFTAEAGNSDCLRASLPFEPVLEDVEAESGSEFNIRDARKLDFARRRHYRRTRRNKSLLHEKMCHHRGLERSGGGGGIDEDALSIPEFAPLSNDSSQGRSSGNISKFFPLNRGCSATTHCGPGRVLSTVCGGQLFIPRLNLEGGLSEDDKRGDDRSFDFCNTVSLDGRNTPTDQEKEPLSASSLTPSETTRTRTTAHQPKVSSTATQVDPPSLSIAKVAAVSVSDSTTFQRNSQTVPSVDEPVGDDTTDGIQIDTCQDEPHEDAKEKLRSGIDASSRDKERELEEMLKSLEMANEMAARLKERSEGMLKVLSDEMMSFQDRISGCELQG